MMQPIAVVFPLSHYWKSPHSSQQRKRSISFVPFSRPWPRLEGARFPYMLRALDRRRLSIYLTVCFHPTDTTLYASFPALFKPSNSPVSSNAPQAVDSRSKSPPLLPLNLPPLPDHPHECHPQRLLLNAPPHVQFRHSPPLPGPPPSHGAYEHPRHVLQVFSLPQYISLMTCSDAFKHALTKYVFIEWIPVICS